MTLYEKFKRMREELSKHKWLESEKAGKDIGEEQALIDWIPKHRKPWLDHLERAEREKNDKRT